MSLDPFLLEMLSQEGMAAGVPRSPGHSSGSHMRALALLRASVTSCAVMAAFIDQPTTRRENRSMTAFTYALRCPDIGEVGDPFAVGSRCFKGTVKHVRRDGGGRPLARIGAGAGVP
jgi:CTP:molybdopterin cytidylyltransferase MocA